MKNPIEINLPAFIKQLVVVAVFLCVPTILFGQHLKMDKNDVLMDEVFGLKVVGLKPGGPVIIRSKMKDTAGRIWQAYAGYYADENGEVDLSNDAPVHGTYTGVNPMGLIQTMNLTGPEYNRARFLTGGFDDIPVKFYLEISHKIIDSIGVLRHFLSPGNQVLSVSAGGLVAKLFAPDLYKEHPGIIVLGGSEGAFGNDGTAAILSSHGYAVLSLAYFGTDGVPDDLNQIPLEYFYKAIAWMNVQKFVKKGGLLFMGTSKGAEAALLAASHYKEIKGVIGYMPSSVVWSCICQAPNSSWTFNSHAVPFIPAGSDPTYSPPQGFPLSPAINYKYRVKNHPDSIRATIPVENINGPILLIAGQDDQLWPSALFGQQILTRLKNKRHAFDDQLLAYPDAGHLIGKEFLPAGSTLIAGGRINTGGTPMGNANAQMESWPTVLNFIRKAILDIK